MRLYISYKVGKDRALLKDTKERDLTFYMSLLDILYDEENIWCIMYYSIKMYAINCMQFKVHNLRKNFIKDKTRSKIF